MIQAGSGGPVKIGWTRSRIEARRYQLQVAHYEELYIIRTFPGMGEQLLHRHFSAYHLRGEWFHFHPTMLSLSDEELQRPSTNPIPRPLDKRWTDEQRRAVSERMLKRYALRRAAAVARMTKQTQREGADAQ
jgi:hypothetical protein